MADYREEMPVNSEVFNEVANYFDRWAEYRLFEQDIPGVQIAIRHQDELVLSRGYGFANVEQQLTVTADHKFRIASHSKMFVATSFVILAERGLLSLDDPASKYVGWLSEFGPDVDQITIRELLSHSSGMIRDGLDGDYWQLYREFPNEGELRELMGNDPLVLKRNDQFKYSNIGFSILGLAIEKASGKAFSEFIASEILGPLEMSNSGADFTDTIGKELAVGYSSKRPGLDRQPFEQLHTFSMDSATGMYSTAEDICKFGAAHFFGNETLITDDGKRLMQDEIWPITQTKYKYGLGMVHFDAGGRNFVGHTGGFPGFISVTLIHPEDQFVISVLTNSIDANANEFAFGFAKLLQLAEQHAEKNLPPLPSEAKKFTTRVSSIWEVADIVSLSNQLLQLYPHETDPTALVSELDYVSETTLRYRTSPGLGAPGELIEFRFDKSGEVESIIGECRQTCYPLSTFNRRFVNAIPK